MLTTALNLKSLLCVDYNATKNVVVGGATLYPNYMVCKEA